MTIKQRSKKTKTNKTFIRIIYLLIILMLVAVFVGKSYYNRIYAANVIVPVVFAGSEPNKVGSAFIA